MAVHKRGYFGLRRGPRAVKSFQMKLPGMENLKLPEVCPECNAKGWTKKNRGGTCLTCNGNCYIIKGDENETESI